MPKNSIYQGSDFIVIFLRVFLNVQELAKQTKQGYP